MPILHEFILVKIRPLKEHAQSALRHPANDYSRLDLDADFLLLVPRMEMRRVVFVVVHEYNDAVESANLGHTDQIYCSPMAKSVLRLTI